MNGSDIMKEIFNFFDDFNLHTRIMPVCIMAVPFIIIAFYRGIIKDVEYKGWILYSIVIIVLIVSSKICRELGKKYEVKMFERLGEKPTTIILRYSDNRIDEHTKTRYHEELNEAIPDLNLPLTKEAEKEDADELYHSAINWLRTTRGTDTTKYSAVYRALREYNFWRNLQGLKYVAIILYVVFASRELFVIGKLDLQQLLQNPLPDYLALIIFIISAILIRIFINMNLVERKAFDYAKTLVESCDIL
jgi:hypothetical protein